VKSALLRLEDEGSLDLKRGTRLDWKRLNKGVFRGKDFVVNATRRFSEMGRRPMVSRSIGPVEVECTCASAEEAMFRPAIYGVDGCEAVGRTDGALEEISQVVSMIGTYRDVISEGESFRASGMLEEVHDGTGSWRRVVVGSGRPGEYVDWPD